VFVLRLQLALVKGESYSNCSRTVDQQVPFQLVTGVPEMLGLVEAVSKEQLAAAADKAAAGVPPPRPPPGEPPSGTAAGGEKSAVPPAQPPPGDPPAAETAAEGVAVVGDVEMQLAAADGDGAQK
jgi:hypothetical protein